MKHGPQSTMRTLVLLIAITCSFWQFAPVATAQTADSANKGAIKGSVYTVDADGGRSAVPGALVKLIGPSFSQETTTNDQGQYDFVGVDADAYEIDVTAPGLSGSATVTVESGAVLDAPIGLQVEIVKESVTVTATVSQAV